MILKYIFKFKNINFYFFLMLTYIMFNIKKDCNNNLLGNGTLLISILSISMYLFIEFGNKNNFAINGLENDDITLEEKNENNKKLLKRKKMVNLLIALVFGVFTTFIKEIKYSGSLKFNISI